MPNFSRCKGAHRAAAELPRMPARSADLTQQRGRQYASSPATISPSRFLYGPRRVTCDGTCCIKCPHAFLPGGGRDSHTQYDRREGGVVGCDRSCSLLNAASGFPPIDISPWSLCGVHRQGVSRVLRELRVLGGLTVHGPEHPSRNWLFSGPRGTLGTRGPLFMVPSTPPGIASSRPSGRRSLREGTTWHSAVLASGLRDPWFPCHRQTQEYTSSEI